VNSGIADIHDLAYAKITNASDTCFVDQHIFLIQAQNERQMAQRTGAAYRFQVSMNDVQVM
jgi:hypothetical protein